VRVWAAVPLMLAVFWTPSAAAASCTPTAASRNVPTALILSGGGAKGAYEAGSAAAFAERGLPFRIVAGSSAGALNAAMIVAGRADRLEALWRAVKKDQVYSLRAPVLFAGLLPGWLTLLALDGAGSLLDSQPLRGLITASVDFERIRSSPIRLLVTATDLARREQRAFDNRTVTVDVLMAAAAVPGAFPAVDVDGALLVDGGLTGRAPVLEALAASSVERAVVVLSYAPDEQSARPTTILRSLESALETVMLHNVRRDVELARLKYPAVDVQLLSPSAPLSLRPLEFDPDGMARILALGRSDALECLKSWGE